GNVHSVHRHSEDPNQAVETARRQIADLINAEAREVVFTSGATEANNIAVKGVARFHMRQFGRAHIVTLTTEHKCVLESCRDLEREGVRVTYLAPAADGMIDLAAFEDALEDDTVLVSILAANNEIGVIQPLAEIGSLCRDRGIVLHTDAAQAFGKVTLDVAEMGIGLLSISGHKIYGPKGIGALYFRRRPRVRLDPLFSGGGQERGLRSGTLPAPLAIGLGEAAALAAGRLKDDEAVGGRLRDRLLAGLRRHVPDLVVNGAMTPRLPGNLNVAFPGVDALALLDRTKDSVSASAGSACMAAEVEPSYVLTGIGLPRDIAASSIRLCIGRPTTEAEVDHAADVLGSAVIELRGSAVAAQ
ncbi:MAG: aminotransferase class V-fold PLP-dependent enzyme, partial [Pseudomonadota bacterium]